MLPSTETIETFFSNEEEIQEKIEARRLELFEKLSSCIDMNTNDYFDISEDDLPTLTELCELTKRIQSLTSIRNNAVTLPPKPKTITSNAIVPRELDIKNKIQYCNNLLRYTLRRNGISFNENLNVMEDLIEKIKTIKSVKIFNQYISNIDLDQDGNLDVTYIPPESILVSDVLSFMDFEDGDLIFESSPYNDEYGELYIELILNEEGNLEYQKTKDIWVGQ